MEKLHVKKLFRLYLILIILILILIIINKFNYILQKQFDEINQFLYRAVPKI